MRKKILGLSILVALAGCRGEASEPAVPVSDQLMLEQILGRWNVLVESPAGEYPSWFEIHRADGGLSGRFVARTGGARPIEAVEFERGLLRFEVANRVFEADFVDNQFRGTVELQDGVTHRWSAIRAPELRVPETIEWGEPIRLFNGHDLEGWRPRDPAVPNSWSAQQGLLVNRQRGTDLLTEESFRDFRLYLEFRYPEGSNSGVYLRGRYEVQIQDDYGRDPEHHYSGGIYGFLPPRGGAVRPPGQWQSFDITLLGRYVTVVLNGVTVIDGQEIPGITGGALDPHEAEPGPILLQGDHGAIEFRNPVLTPVLQNPA